MTGKHTKLQITAALFALLAVAGCTTTGIGITDTAPKPSSANQGASASADLLAALDGGLIGRAKPVNISRVDKNTALQSEYRALEYTAPGEAVLWRGTRLSGEIIPSQPYRVGSQDCRQYEHVVTDQTAKSSVKGTACRNPDGSWTLLS